MQRPRKNRVCPLRTVCIVLVIHCNCFTNSLRLTFLKLQCFKKVLNLGSQYFLLAIKLVLTLKAPNTTKAAFANTVDPDGTAHNEPSTVFAPLSLIFQHYTVYAESFPNFCRRNFVVCFFGALQVNLVALKKKHPIFQGYQLTKTKQKFTIYEVRLLV